MSAVLLSVLLSSPPPYTTTSVAIPGTREAVLHRRANAGTSPAVLLIQGWWTPEPWDEAMGLRLVRSGYHVLRVMPERGERPADRDAMHALMTGPPDERTLAGLRAARDWLLARDYVRGKRVAVLGARMGGRDALYLAAEPGFVGAVSWYGVPPREISKTTAIAFFGGKDMGPSMEDARRFEAAARGTATKVHIYPEAQHGFADPQNPWGGYDKTAATDSWTRASLFLEASLKGPPADADPADGEPLWDAVTCVMSAWNAYDVEASRKCYTADAVARNAHGVVPIDWEMETRLRAFDRVARSRFRADIRQTQPGALEYRLHETNDFLAALGLEGVSALWRYVIRDGRIAEEEHLDADASFGTRLRKFTEWGRVSKPAGWESVVDSEGIVRFDGSTAPALIRLAREWSATR